MRFSERLSLALPILLALGLVGWLTWPASSTFLVYGGVTAAVAVLLTLAGLECVKLLRERGASRQARWPSVVGLAAVLAVAGLYTAGLTWKLQPAWLPKRSWYDFIENRAVTMRLVDPALVKVEQWEILGDTREVLFVHPAPNGATTLVYPVMVRPGAVLATALALAPEAWSGEGDGVLFAIYIEDDAGIHLMTSQYIDPKHHQQDRRWVPVTLDLSPYAGKLVRIIFSVSGGPAGDIRYDWSGWAEPKLVEPAWP